MLNISAEEEYSEEDYTVKSCAIALQKSYLVLVSDQEEYGLNNVIMGVPGVLEGSKAISSPAPLFGFQNTFLGKSISELCANMLKRPCLLLINVQGMQSRENICAKIALKCVKRLLKKLEK